MTEKSQLKFVKSEETGELIGFVSRHAKTRKLKGVREDSRFRKKICVLSDRLKKRILPNILYDVELKAMYNGNGYIVEEAIPVLFEAHIESVVIPKAVYQIAIKFGNKTIYFDPIEGKTSSSRTVSGVIDVLNERHDIDNRQTVIADFKKRAQELLRRMEIDGYYFKIK